MTSYVFIFEGNVFDDLLDRNGSLALENSVIPHPQCLSLYGECKVRHTLGHKVGVVFPNAIQGFKTLAGSVQAGFSGGNAYLLIL
jgi:hypothetical protein